MDDIMRDLVSIGDAEEDGDVNERLAFVDEKRRYGDFADGIGIVIRDVHVALAIRRYVGWATEAATDKSTDDPGRCDFAEGMV